MQKYVHVERRASLEGVSIETLRDNIFRGLDRDGDGRVEAAEVAAATDLSDGEVAETIAEADVDGDGELDAAEVAVAIVDQDGDDEIDAAELAAATGATEEEAAEEIALADTDGDGKLDVEEIRAAYTKLAVSIFRVSGLRSSTRAGSNAPFCVCRAYAETVDGTLERKPNPWGRQRATTTLMVDPSSAEGESGANAASVADGASAEPRVICQTKLGKRLDAEWNSEHTIEPLRPGELLEFTVYNKGAPGCGDRVLGRAVLPSAWFHSCGFEGELTAPTRR
jgi:Ca2+-binding EF-hand superfamily protein